MTDEELITRLRARFNEHPAAYTHEDAELHLAASNRLAELTNPSVSRDAPGTAEVAAKNYVPPYTPDEAKAQLAAIDAGDVGALIERLARAWAIQVAPLTNDRPRYTKQFADGLLSVAELAATPPEVRRLRWDQIPAADTLVEYQDGSVMPLMFHFATESEDLTAVLDEQGFEHFTLPLEQDEAASAIWQQIEDDITVDSDVILRQWTPPAVEGWRLVGKRDTEDGPIAWYIRPKAALSAQGER